MFERTGARGFVVATEPLLMDAPLGGPVAFVGGPFAPSVALPTIATATAAPGSATGSPGRQAQWGSAVAPQASMAAPGFAPAVSAPLLAHNALGSALGLVHERVVLQRPACPTMAAPVFRNATMVGAQARTQVPT